MQVHGQIYITEKLQHKLSNQKMKQPPLLRYAKSLAILALVSTHGIVMNTSQNRCSVAKQLFSLFPQLWANSTFAYLSA